MTLSTDVRRARRTYAVVAVVVPLLLTVVAVALMLLWLPEMPVTIAVHWNANGAADGFGPAWLTPLLTAGLGLLLAAVFGGIGLAASRGGEWASTMRFLGALALATTVFALVLLTCSFGAQRGLSDADESPAIGIALLVGLGCAIVGGIAAWFAQPSIAAADHASSEVVPLRLEPGRNAVWLRTTTMAPPAMIAVIAAVSLITALAVGFALIGVAVWMLMAGVAVLLATLAATTFVFRVRVSEQGLRVASSVGVPRWTIPLADIAGVDVVEVHPMSQFGGWGIRIGVDGRLGVVLHSGPAIQVTRVDGRRFAVTVDDAPTGASLLAALRERSPAGTSA